MRYVLDECDLMPNVQYQPRPTVPSDLPQWQSQPQLQQDTSRSKATYPDPYGHKPDSAIMPPTLLGRMQAVEAGLVDGVPDSVPLGAYPRLVAAQLSYFDVGLATEVAAHANYLRERRVRLRVQRNGGVSASMRDAISIVVRCRGRDPFGPREAEERIRKRLRRTDVHCLHTYGAIIHVTLYPFTVLLALAALLSLGVKAVGRLWLPDTKRSSADIAGSGTLQCLTVGFVFLFAVLPLSVLLVAASAVLDVILLWLRPVMPSSWQQSLVLWFFPSSLAFWAAGAGGFLPGLLAHRFLGASVLEAAFVNLNLGGELCNTQSQSQPPTPAFQAAVACDPHFLAQHAALRPMALRGIPELYAPAGGPMAQMPPVVRWAYLLGDSELCLAWEAESLGSLSKLDPTASLSHGGGSGGGSMGP